MLRPSILEIVFCDDKTCLQLRRLSGIVLGPTENAEMPLAYRLMSVSLYTAMSPLWSTTVNWALGRTTFNVGTVGKC